MRIETADSLSDQPVVAGSEARCPFCGRPGTPLYFEVRGQDDVTYRVHRCAACATAFLWPPPSPEQLSLAYAGEYYGAGETKFGRSVEKFREVIARARVRAISRGLRPGARILDVGCGDGRLLRRFGETGPYELHGIELAGRAAERAAQVPRIQLHIGRLNDVELDPAAFDLVTLVHVFEHLPEPRPTLGRLARLVRPGGRLFLVFPNITSWQARWSRAAWFHLDPPRHLALVPPAAVVAHLQTLGFRLRAERHFCIDQNLYGWLQSFLNRHDRWRNFLYERLKRNDGYAAPRGRGSFAGQAALAGALLAPALLIDLASALAHAGATVELTLEKVATP